MSVSFFAFSCCRVVIKIIFVKLRVFISLDLSSEPMMVMLLFLMVWFVIPFYGRNFQVCTRANFNVY